MIWVTLIILNIKMKAKYFLKTVVDNRTNITLFSEINIKSITDSKMFKNSDSLLIEKFIGENKEIFQYDISKVASINEALAWWKKLGNKDKDFYQRELNINKNYISLSDNEIKFIYENHESIC